MILSDFDLPRMRDHLTADDLDTDACVTLAGVILEEAADSYMRARRRYTSNPTEANRAHLKNQEDFYRSDYFKALSCGLADGDAVMRDLDKRIGGRHAIRIRDPHGR